MNETFICAHCGREHPIEDRYTFDGQEVCRDCYETGTCICAYTGLNLPHAREKPATSPENFRHLAGEGCQCKRETTYCEEHTKNV